jgi:regulator of protease activity HflC (stomatin/prohibitin superfamily)
MYANNDAPGFPWGAWITAAILLAIVVLLVVYTFRLISQFERAIVFRLGKFVGVRGPGLVIVVPFLEAIYETVDMRVIAKQLAIDAMTSDKVSLEIHAVVFYQVIDAQAASLLVEDYDEAIDLAAQTSLRNAIGASNLKTVLSDRQSVDARVAEGMNRVITSWGVLVHSVDINDVELPKELSNAMSQGAQAEAEAEARTLLAQSEITIAQKFLDAAAIYDKDPVALELRKMNLTYEAVKTGQTQTIIVPSNAFSGLGVGPASTTTTNATSGIAAGIAAVTRSAAAGIRSAIETDPKP